MTFPTLLDRFINHPAARALGWALLHFVWQGAILAAIFHIANTLTRQSRASLRYVIGCIVMLLMPIVFVATILQNGHSPATALSAQHSIASGLFQDGSAATSFVSNGRIVRVTYPFNSLPGWIGCLWLAGVAALSLYTAVGWLRAQGLDDAV